MALRDSEKQEVLAFVFLIWGAIEACLILVLIATLMLGKSGAAISVAVGMCLYFVLFVFVRWFILRKL